MKGKVLKKGSIHVLYHDIPVALSVDTMLIYRKAFKSDLFQDMDDMEKQEISVRNERANKIGWQVTWALAKTADPKIPKLERWAKQFGGIAGLVMVNELNKQFMNKG